MTRSKAKARDEAAEGISEPASPSVIAKGALDPYARHGGLASDLAGRALGPEWKVDPWLYAATIRDNASEIDAGDLERVSHMLFAQAQSLDAIFTESARRMVQSMGARMDVFEIYARIAIKAQANSRTTLEALAKLHQPREQIVRHVHVNEGGQAVIADEFHHHPGGKANEGMRDQPQEPHSAPQGRSALSCAQSGGQPLPVPCNGRKEALSASRRQKSRGTTR